MSVSKLTKYVLCNEMRDTREEKDISFADVVDSRNCIKYTDIDILRCDSCKKKHTAMDNHFAQN